MEKSLDFKGVNTIHFHKRLKTHLQNIFIFTVKKLGICNNGIIFALIYIITIDTGSMKLFKVIDIQTF